MAMGENQLKELRKQAERAIADKDPMATARTSLYVGELMATQLTRVAEALERQEKQTLGRDVWGDALALFREARPLTDDDLLPICADPDCPDSQYHGNHDDGELDPAAEAARELSQEYLGQVLETICKDR